MKKITSRRMRNRMTALILTIIMSIAVFPVSSIALENKVTENPKKTTVESSEVINEKDTHTDEVLEPIIVEEVVSQRTQYSKTFICDDGSYISAEYTQSVHYKDDNGNWTEFTEDVSVNSNAKLTVGEKTEADEKADGNEKLIKLLADGYAVSWTPEMQTATELKAFNSGNPSVLQSTKKSALTSDNLVKEKQLIKEAYSERQSNASGVSSEKADILSEEYIEKTNNSINEYNSSVIHNVRYNTTVVEYENALGEGIDIRYTITSHSVKEDVIVEEPGIFESYSVSVDSGELIPQKNEDGSIEFYDGEGNVPIQINAPLMYDANNSTSTDILVEIGSKNNEYVITYTPSRQWLTDIERQYPVVIDPNYTKVTDDSIKMYQTFVSERKNNQGFSNFSFMCIGEADRPDNNDRNFGTSEGWFRLSELPDFSNKIIRYSYVDFTLNPEKQGNTTIDAYIPGKAFNATVTWESKPLTAYRIAENISASYSNSNYYYYYRIPLSNLSIQWGHVDAIAYGIYLKPSYNSTGYSLLLTSNSTVNPPVYVYGYEAAPTTATSDEVNISTGYYYIKSADYQNSYLSVDTASNEVVIKNTVSGSTGKWYVINHGDNIYTFTPLVRDRFRMEVHCADYSDYRPMTIYNYTDYGDLSSNAIRYKIIRESSGKYSIRPVSSKQYALSVYNETDCNMYFYNYYQKNFKVVEKNNCISCQLNKYKGNNGQEWEFISTGQCYIDNKPTVVKGGMSYNVMTTSDYQYVKAKPENSTEGCYWASTNPSVATIQGSGNTARITPVGAGTTTITLTNRFGIQCDSFTLIVCDPSNPDNDQNTAELCELRGYWLEVPLMPQTQNNTCGSACVAMILKYFDIKDDNGQYLTDQQVYAIANQNGEGTHVYRVKYVLDLKLGNNVYHYSPNCTNIENMLYTIRTSLIAGRPVIAQIKLNDSNNEFGYQTGGHYVLVTGIYKDSNGAYQVVVNDPFSASWAATSHVGQVVGMPLTSLLNYLKAHDHKYLIY